MMVAVPAVIVLALAWWVTGRLCSPGSFLHLLDHPNERSLHHVPTPRTGGLAIIASVLIGLGVAALVVAVERPPMGFLPKGLASGSLWIVGSIVLVSVVSFLDDRSGLSAGLRFALQAIAAVVVVWGVGLTLPSIPIPAVETIPLGWMAAPVSMLFLLWMTNLYNFMDGMDGFAGGMTALGFGFLAYFAWSAGHTFMFLIATLVSMGALGFLFYNLPPARIFMGDVGSISMGFTCGTVILLGLRDGLFDLWVPILVFSPFILDATVTVLRRAWQRKRIWEAHRDHYYQRLVVSGWGHRKTMVAEYVLMLTCGLSAIVYYRVGETWRLAILMGWIVTYVILAWAIRKAEQHPREPRAQA